MHAGGHDAPPDGLIAAEAHDIPRTRTGPEPGPARCGRRRTGRRRRYHRHLPALPRPSKPASPRCCSRPATAWAARGTGTAIPGHGSTRRATPTPTCSRRSCSRSGSGRSTSREQPEIERYLNHVVDRFDLRRHMRFGARVTSATYDESSGRWTVETSDGTEYRARFLVAATGVLSVPYFPDVPGRQELSRRVVPHGDVADDAGRLRRQARRRHRHRIERRTGDPGHRRRGRLPDRLPTHRQLVHAAQQRADHARGAGSAPGRLRGDVRDAEHVAVRVPPPRARSPDLRRLRSPSVWPSSRRCGTAPGSRS